VAFETNCRVDPGSVRRFEILTNTDASGSGIRTGASMLSLLCERDETSLSYLVHLTEQGTSL
jgi:hypothetical protein